MSENRSIQPPVEQRFDPEVVNALIRGRRTIKPPQFDERTIPRTVIDALLENANWAPTHGMTEPWRFRVYAGPAREQLAQQLPQIYRAVTPVYEQRPDKIEKLQRNPRSASHIIALLLQRHEGKIPELEEVEAVACAVQNMSLTAFAHGVAAFWSTGAMVYSEAAHAELNLAPEQKLLGFLYLGYPRVDLPSGVRQPVADKTTWM